MRSVVLPAFRKMLERLPEHVQQDARAGFEKWKQDPKSVGWKRLHGTRAELHSVQIGLRHRAIGVVDKTKGVVVWMFVGSHETYNHWIDVHRKMTAEHWCSGAKINPHVVEQKINARRACTATNQSVRPSS